MYFGTQKRVGRKQGSVNINARYLGEEIVDGLSISEISVVDVKNTTQEIGTRQMIGISSGGSGIFVASTTSNKLKIDYLSTGVPYDFSFATTATTPFVNSLAQTSYYPKPYNLSMSRSNATGIYDFWFGEDEKMCYAIYESGNFTSVNAWTAIDVAGTSASYGDKITSVLSNTNNNFQGMAYRLEGESIIAGHRSGVPSYIRDQELSPISLKGNSYGNNTGLSMSKDGNYLLMINRAHLRIVRLETPYSVQSASKMYDHNLPFSQDSGVFCDFDDNQKFYISNTSGSANFLHTFHIEDSL